MSTMIKNVRLSFPELFEPKAFEEGGRKRFSAAFLVQPGSDQAKLIESEIERVAREKWPKEYAKRIAQYRAAGSGKFCFYDGNSKDYDGYEGMLVLAAHRPEAQGRPLVIDGLKQPLQPADGKPYAGCYVNALVDFWAQDDGKYQGIRCTLAGVQFYRDGDAFSGAKVATPDDFETVGEATADDLV